jgi:hypothetical protein
MKNAPWRGGGTAFDRGKTGGKVRDDPANARTGYGGYDANAPPKHSPKTPFAPSSPMVGAEITPQDEGRFSAKSARGAEV